MKPTQTIPAPPSAALLILATLCSLSGCMMQAHDEAHPCTADVVNIEGTQLCIAPRPIQETGFQCPSGAPFASSYGDLAVCSPSPQLPAGALERIHEQYPEDMLPDPCAEDSCVVAACHHPNGCTFTPIPRPRPPACVPAVGGEVCGDGADNDCDGMIDCADPSCASDPQCATPPTDRCEDPDQQEPNDLLSSATPVTGTRTPITLCQGDTDWFLVPAAPTAREVRVRDLLADPLMEWTWFIIRDDQTRILVPGDARDRVIPLAPGEGLALEAKIIAGGARRGQHVLGVLETEITTSGAPGACTPDAYEPNDTATTPSTFNENLYTPGQLNLTSCPGDEDWFTMPTAPHDGYRHQLLMQYMDQGAPASPLDFTIMQIDAQGELTQLPFGHVPSLGDPFRIVESDHTSIMVQADPGARYLLRVANPSNRPVVYSLNQRVDDACDERDEQHDTIATSYRSPALRDADFQHAFTVCPEDVDWMQLTDNARGTHTTSPGDRVVVEVWLSQDQTLSTPQLYRQDAQGTAHLLPLTVSARSEQNATVLTGEYVVQPGDLGELHLKLEGNHGTKLAHANVMPRILRAGN